MITKVLLKISATSQENKSLTFSPSSISDECVREKLNADHCIKELWVVAKTRKPFPSTQCEHSPPTPPWPVGSSAVWASLRGRCQHSGGWWGSPVWSAGLLEVHSSPLGSAPSGCPLPGVWKRQITMKSNRRAASLATSPCAAAGSSIDFTTRLGSLFFLCFFFLSHNVHIWKNSAGVIEAAGVQLEQLSGDEKIRRTKQSRAAEIQSEDD